MLKIGITGGIGSGKSVVSELFRIHDIPVYDADSQAKRLNDTSPAIREKLIAQFGTQIYTENKLNKSAFAAIIFSDTEKLQQANAIIHPYLLEDFKRWCAQRKHKSIVAMDAALLIFKTFIAGNSSLEEILEDESIFWNDDIDIIQSFVLKTIKRFEEKTGTAQALLPMFKDEADKKFAIDLLYNALDNEKKYREIILRHAENWEQDRIALIDLVIMQVAIAELTAFIEIPTSVTLNEYIDIAKIYSTPKSGTFINGILDAIVQELKKENKLII